MVGGTRFELVTPTMSKRVPLANGKFGEERPVVANAEVGRKSPKTDIGGLRADDSFGELRASSGGPDSDPSRRSYRGAQQSPCAARPDPHSYRSVERSSDSERTAVRIPAADSILRALITASPEIYPVPLSSDGVFRRRLVTRLCATFYTSH